MLLGILLGLLLTAADIKFIKPCKSFLATIGVSYLTVTAVWLVDQVVPYTLVGYCLGFVAALVLMGVVLLVCSILPEVEEL